MARKLAKLLFVLAAAGFGHAVPAAPVTSEQARKAVGTWLSRGYALDRALNRRVSSARVCQTTNGVPFHVVKLEGGGFVVTSGDTTVEPVIAFSASADLSEGERSPLWTLLRQDLARRAGKGGRARLKSASAPSAGQRAAKTPEERWADLTSPPPLRGAVAAQNDDVDIRVAPLVKSKWGQGRDSEFAEVGAENCYNLHTPNNAVCGCVARRRPGSQS